MIFELCDLIKEKITNINDEVLDKVAQITKVNTVEHALKTTETEKHLTYTPVTKETFAKWCEIYKESMAEDKESRRSQLEAKPSGRQLFEMNKQAFEDLTLEDAPEEEMITEENKEEFEEDDEGEDFTYDTAIYCEGLADEDVDFD
jgi:hypothetical protein